MAIVSDVEIRLRADIARLQADMDAARRTVGGAMTSIASSIKLANAAAMAFLGGLAKDVVLGFLRGLVGLVQGGSDAAAALNDLSIQTGASVAALMQFKAIGATSDTTTEALAGAMNKLAKGMAVANEESKGLPQALSAIGLNFADIKKLSPEMQMLEIAKAMDGFGNGSGKAAVAMALYGKEGAKLLPFLADLAGEAGNVTAALTEQEIASKKALAAMADNYGDNLTKIKLASAETSKAISLGMLPALYEASSAFIAVTSATGGLKDTIKKLSADGTIAEWTRNAITVLTYLTDALQITARVAQSVFKIISSSLSVTGNTIAGVANAMVLFIRGEYSSAWEAMKSTAAKNGATISGAIDGIADAFSSPTFGAKMRAQLAVAKDVKAEAEAVKKQINYSAQTDAASTAAEDKRLKQYHDLLAVMNEHVQASAREAAGMEPLNAAQKEAIKITEELKSGKLKLLPVEEALIRSRVAEWESNLASIESQKALLKMNDEMVKAEKMMAGDRAAVLKRAGDEADANEELARTFGMTKAAIEQVELARLKEQLAQRASTGMTADEITQLENLIALKERSAAAVADVEAMTQAKEFWSSVDKTAHDTFVSIAAGGKDAFTRLKDTAKNVFFDWLYQMTLKKWILNIGTSISGAGVSSLASAAGGGGGSASSLFSMGKTIYDGFATGFSGLSTGVADAVQVGMNQVGLSSNFLTNGPFATAVGNVAAGAAGALAGRAIGNAIAGDYKVSHGQAITNIAAVAGTLIAGPIGGIIGGALGGVFNRAFGMGSKNAGATTLNGTLAGGAFNGTADTPWTQSGGWFRSNKSGIDKTAIDAGVAATLGTAYQSITSASAAYAKVLGLNAGAIAGRTQSLSITLGKDQAANQKAIEDFFIGVGDNIARELLPNIALFQAEGESAAATLQRLASNFQTVGAVLSMMGTTSAQAFGATGAAAIEASERLVALAGGVQALASQAQYFADNFLTGAEKVAPAQKQLTEVLGALGYGYVKTVDQYKTAVLDLAKSGALATTAGAQTYAALLALAPAFKTVTDYANELKAAANDSASAALDALSKAVDAQKNVVTAAYTRAMDVLDERIAGLNATISATTELSKALRGGIASVDSPAAGMAGRQVALAQVGAALAIAKASGMLPSADSLGDALAALRATSADQFATMADYQRSVAQSNAALEQLGGLTDGQLSAAEQQLAATIAQKDAAALANEAQLGRLDNLLAAAQAQIAAVNGINANIMTVGQALVGVYGAAQVLSGYTGISATAVTATGGPSATIDTGALLAELQTLNARIASMEEHAATTASSTDQFARQFNTVSAGGNALLTEQA